METTLTFRNPVADLAPLAEVAIRVDLHLGCATFAIEDLARLRAGMVLVLPQSAGGALYVSINGIVAARAEIAVAREGVSVRITELIG